MRVRDARGVDCPTCGAVSPDRCLSTRTVGIGQPSPPRRVSHTSRRYAAMEAATDRVNHTHTPNAGA